MVKGTKVTARFSDGQVLTRTTTLPLTHAWKWVGRRHVDNGGEIAANTGFAGSREKAERALASDAAYITKPNGWNNNKPGELTFSEIVEIERTA